MICPKCQKRRASIEFKGRSGLPYKNCVTCRAKAPRLTCENCPHYAYCASIVNTILPVACQQELTAEQERVIREMPFDIRVEVIYMQPVGGAE